MQELKATAEDKGAEQYGAMDFNANGFFTELVEMSSERLDLFLSLFPRFPEILECSRKAVKEEKRRRFFEEEIAKLRKEKGKKIKRQFVDEIETETMTRKRLRMLTGDTGTGKKHNKQ